MTLLVSCGDDDNNNGETRNIDGVNVITGKKWVELTISSDDNNKLPYVFNIKYDSKGRLSEIWGKEIAKNNNGDRKEYYTGEYVQIASIDYDLRIIKLLRRDFYNKNDLGSTYQLDKTYNAVNFSLNNSGYISQIGSSILNYDTYGYLIGVNEPKAIITTGYENNELIKSATSYITKGFMSLYYVSYGEIDNKGDLYIRVRQDSSNDPYYSSDYYYEFRNLDIAVLVAYQAGLLGKVSKTMLHLKNNSGNNAMIDYDFKNHTSKGKISFVCQ